MGMPTIGDPNEPIEISLDGGQWCATRTSFEDLVQDVAGFGPTPIDALRALLDEEEINR